MSEDLVPLSSPGTRVLLIGSGRHAEDSQVPSIPQVEDTVRELAVTLAQRCGVEPTVLLDPEDPIELGDAIAKAAREATDVLVVYYIGHGLISPGNALHLATVATDDPMNGLAFKALPYQAVREALATSRARSTVVVLDCCFAGRALGSLGTPASDAFTLAATGGTYLLAAAAASEQALAPVGQPYTAFTGQLISLLRDGDPNGPRLLTIDHVFRYLRREMTRRDLPAPARQPSGQAGDLVLCRNPAYRAPLEAVAQPQIIGDEPDCPYRGLDFFTQDDAAVFFGREEQVEEILGRLAGWVDSGGLIALVGLSGVGKSSLIHAGLLPALQRGELAVPGSRTWPHLVLTPGDDPLAHLAQRLSGASDIPAEEITARIAEDPAQLAVIIQIALRRYTGGKEVAGGRLVLFIDQFEELFTAEVDERHRRTYVAALHAAAAGVAVVIFGLRADFYAQAMIHPELVEALRDRQLPLAPMTQDQLREAIEKPALAVGVPLEDGLAENILRDLQGNAEFTGGALPLLSYALQLTWMNRAGGPLTHSAYESTGGIWEAVTQQADVAYESLDSAGQAAARMLLLRMVHLGAATDDTRKSLDLSVILDDMSTVDRLPILSARDGFAQRRLITIDGDIARISHEALLRHWPRLRKWIEQDRQGLLVHRQLAEDAEKWQLARQSQEYLYTGTRLEATADWADDNPDQLTQTERDFLRAGGRARRERRGMLAGAVLVLVMLLIALPVAGVLAYQNMNDRTDGDARRIAQQADALRGVDPATAFQLNLVAFELAPGLPETRSGLIASSTNPHPVVLSAHQGAVRQLAFTADGHILASADARTVKLWNTTDPRRPSVLRVLPSPGTEPAIAMDQQRPRLAVAAGDRLEFWDVVKQTQTSSVPAPGARELVFSPDGGTLAVLGDQGLALWDVTGQPAQLFTAPLPGTESLTGAFSHDGRTLATSAKAQGSTVIQLWEVADSRAASVQSAIVTDVVGRLCFSHDGRVLLATTSGTGVDRWNVADRQKPSPIEKRYVGGHDKSSSLFTAAGNVLISATAAGQTDFQGVLDNGDITGESRFRTIPSASPFRSIAASAESGVSAFGLDGGQIQVWASRRAAPGLPGTHGTFPRPSFGDQFNRFGNLYVNRVSPSDRRVQLWDTNQLAAPKHLFDFPEPWTEAGFWSATGQLITYSADGKVALWDVSDPARPRPVLQVDGERSPALSPDGTLLATIDRRRSEVDIHRRADDGSWAKVGAYRTGLVPAVDHQIGFAGTGALYVPEGDEVVLLDIRDPANPRRVDKLTGAADREISVGIGQTFISAAKYGDFPRAWDLREPGKPVDCGSQLELGTAATVRPLSGDKVLVQSMAGGALTVWDLHEPCKPKLISTVKKTGETARVVVSRDGRYFAEGPLTGTAAPVRVWDVGGKDAPVEIATVPLPDDVNWMEFLPQAGWFAMETGLKEPRTALLDIDAERVHRTYCDSDPVFPISDDQWIAQLHGQKIDIPCS
ncbi:hypothetical protein D5S17_30865 [Pseudonocardiaceae bacterium YIM PH 21723]|nr:hypothetical protein D5S17_30865 [Pseudonocardiaceae bacterium YIM PH 21723]